MEPGFDVRRKFDQKVDVALRPVKSLARAAEPKTASHKRPYRWQLRDSGMQHDHFILHCAQF